MSHDCSAYNEARIAFGNGTAPVADCCSADAIRCSNDGQRITKLWFSGATNPAGFAKLASLTSLYHLDMGGSNFVGQPLPHALANITSLKWLGLSSCNFTGPLPTFLQQLTNLEYLYAPVNAFSGPIPDIFGPMSALTHIDLGMNAFTGSLPDSLLKLPNLAYLSFSKNNLTGPLPYAIGQLTSLRQLCVCIKNPFPNLLYSCPQADNSGLDSNQFTDPLPDELFLLGNLTYFGGFRNLDSNQFNGTLSPNIGRLVHLEQLFLSSNMFSGRVPATLNDLRWWASETSCWLRNSGFQCREEGLSENNFCAYDVLDLPLCKGPSSTLTPLSAAPTVATPEPSSRATILLGLALPVVAVVAFLLARRRYRHDRMLLVQHNTPPGVPKSPLILPSPEYKSLEQNSLEPQSPPDETPSMMLGGTTLRITTVRYPTMGTLCLPTLDHATLVAQSATLASVAEDETAKGENGSVYELPSGN
ncbi:hypothetical protein RI367_006534 [Sorochytrium milnesiophthora]